MELTLRMISRRTKKKWLLIFLGLNIADALITAYALSHGFLEGNWYGYLLGFMPIWGVMLLKTGLACLVAYLIYRFRQTLFKPLNIGMGGIVAFNVLVLSGVIA